MKQATDGGRMDNRLKKFSFDESQLKALDNAITILVAYDVIEQKSQNKDKNDVSFWVLQQRLSRAGRNGRNSTQPLGSQPITSRLHDEIHAMSLTVLPVIQKMTPLQCVLLLMELRTASPYAEFPKAVEAKLTVNPKARDLATQRAAAWMDFRLPQPLSIDAVMETVAKAVSDAEGAHKSFWGPLFKVFGGGALAIAVGLFAGPLIGGLVGTYLLGLSGAAAVSAGLALLGGGALAAGGFGMVGGSIVIATAFGAAGAGASTMFLGEGGDAAARLAFIKHQAAFACLTRLGLMDHELAKEFLDTTASELARYSKIAEGRSESASAAKVTEGIQQALTWMQHLYADATGKQLVRLKPLAWDAEVVTADGVKDEDMRVLLDRAAERERILSECIWLLENANRSYNEVGDHASLRSLLGLLDKQAGARLRRGNAFLREVAAEVTTLALAQQAELAELVTALNKVEDLREEHDRLSDITNRYRQLTLQLRRRVDALERERGELIAENSVLRAAAAAALFRCVVADVQRMLTSPQLGAGAAIPVSARGANRAGDSVLNGARLAVLWATPSTRFELSPRPQAANLLLEVNSSESRRSSGYPRFRPPTPFGSGAGRLADVHVDKFDKVPEAVQQAPPRCRSNHEIAYSLHVAHDAFAAMDEVGANV
ncbi:MAG: hypothetical protein IPG81_13870 [Sandaracinaceae bacterium]|nr:hypothetical protein [Sandaracinaceae bacterium]